MPVNKTTMGTSYLLWSIPAAIIVAASVAGNPHLVAFGIGLAGAVIVRLDMKPE